MKKQVFAIALLTLPAVLFAPFGGGRASAPSRQPVAPTTTTISSAAQLVAVPGYAVADLVAGAATVAPTGGNATSPAGLAAAAFVQNGSVTITTTTGAIASSQSSRLGRLSK